MNTAVINIKIDPTVKTKAQKTAAKLGFSLSSLISGYLRELIRSEIVHFEGRNEEPSEYMIKALKESEEDRKAGRFVSFDSGEKALGYLDKLLNEGKKG